MTHESIQTSKQQIILKQRIKKSDRGENRTGTDINLKEIAKKVTGVFKWIRHMKSVQWNFTKNFHCRGERKWIGIG